ncbi:Hypothetical_protein [Hexamita inflata]|uniref:Hypothetical_protein n=1 Tax=Hexamita inflata TaxID=28002 RepID=A0AA86QWW9_9EUKA|nr:Hypothetical protein HINF_LOCUS49927 [Hexamita inflata]
MVFYTLDGIKGMLLHLEEAPSEERVNARFSCACIGFRALASLGLFLLGMQVLFSLFQDVFNVIDFVQRFYFLLEFFAKIFRYEISLVEGQPNNHRVGLYLRDLNVCVVFCVVLYNIFKFAAQFFLGQFGLKLFFQFQCFTQQDQFIFEVQFLCLGLLKIHEFSCQSIYVKYLLDIIISVENIHYIFLLGQDTVLFKL